MTKKAKSKVKTVPSGDCTIPPPIAAKDLSRLVMPRDDDEVQKIVDYVEWQATDEKVEHAEKVSTEFVMGRKHECWDVRTDKTRWWVITSPTNLYSQDLMPSLDYTLSFHVGVMARVASANKPDVNELEQLLMADAWRRWEQAGELLNEAEEAEDFQSVGMRCRECLIVMVRTISQPEMVPEGSAPPKHADVVHWCELIANHVAKGSSAKEVRGYLKSTSKSCWELVNWLTHAQNATRADAILAHDVTQHILATFGTAMFRHRQGIPDRCGSCGSYRIALWAPEPDMPMKPRCVACGWMKPESA
jgi:hypothetical protein